MKRKKKKSGSVKAFLLSTQGLPLVLSLTTLAILFVLFRMKNIEQGYQHEALKKSLSKEKLTHKALEAKKTRLASSKNLKKLAKKHQLKEAGQKQIVVIP